MTEEKERIFGIFRQSYSSLRQDVMGFVRAPSKKIALDKIEQHYKSRQRTVERGESLDKLILNNSRTIIIIKELKEVH